MNGIITALERPKIEDEEFGAVRDYMLNTCGIDLSQKRALVESRLRQLVSANGFSSYKDYIREALTHNDLRAELTTRLTTNFTYFMRESAHYEFMIRQAIPELIKKSPSPVQLKVWSAGCSSGDEAFTAAIYLQDFKARTPKLGGYSIRATDISESMLHQAKTGIYSPESLEKLPPALRKRYFHRVEDGSYRVDSCLMSKVRFSSFNLMEPFPPDLSNFDIIFCRNVMIYFTKEHRIMLAKKLLRALKPGGYLFIGLSESLPAADLGFKAVRASILRRES